MRRRRRVATIALAPTLSLTLALAGCAGMDLTLRPSSHATWQVEPVEGELMVHGLPVRSGQIVVSELTSPRSLFITLFLAEPSRFIHAGVVAVEDGQAWVYEALGDLGPTLGRPPTAAIGGGVRRVPLADYLAEQHVVALHDPPPGTDPARMVAWARAAYTAGLPFDPYFDMDDPNRVYCTEFVARVLVAGGAPVPATIAVNTNPSLGVISDWLGIHAAAVIPAHALVAGSRQVALLSREYTPAQIEAYFAFKAELHRRFTPEQKVGNVFSFSIFRGLGLRPDVRDFMGTVRTAAAGWDDLSAAEIDRRVRALAVEKLGPMPPEATSPLRAVAEENPPPAG